MSMEDPFFVVKGEVQKAVNTAQGLFQRWTELLQDPSTATREEIDWTTNELRNNLRSIEWDLEDLDETISIVEANPRKFNLDATELSIRKAFITSTRQVVRDMKDQMSTSSVQALAERKNRQALLGDSGSQSWSTGTMEKYGRLDRELQSANSHFIEEHQAQQQLIVEQQDEQLELVSGSIGVLKNMSQRIGGELEEQAVSAPVVRHSRPLCHPAGRADPLPSAVTRNRRGGGAAVQAALPPPLLPALGTRPALTFLFVTPQLRQLPRPGTGKARGKRRRTARFRHCLS
ncbi:syntaxin-6 isoform X1 [Manis javanica]|uniref:syntaxin-6 isoform X1 n=1 Tax=Manis javanica TaxID=9974 RepID=UPI003C6CE5D5